MKGVPAGFGSSNLTLPVFLNAALEIETILLSQQKLGEATRSQQIAVPCCAPLLRLISCGLLD